MERTSFDSLIQNRFSVMVVILPLGADRNLRGQLAVLAQLGFCAS